MRIRHAFLFVFSQYHWSHLRVIKNKDIKTGRFDSGLQRIEKRLVKIVQIKIDKLEAIRFSTQFPCGETKNSQGLSFYMTGKAILTGSTV